MIGILTLYRHRLRVVLLFLCLLYQYLGLSSSLNDEGFALLRFRDGVVNDPFGALFDWNDEVGVVDPCLWFGVECSDGKVVALDLRNLCLGGTIAPDLGNLAHLKSIILRNNSFSGTIPEKIGNLKELEVLDLGYNNLSGPLPFDLGSNLSLTILLLDNNELLGTMSPEVNKLQMLSEAQVDEDQLSSHGHRSSYNEGAISRYISRIGDTFRRRLQDLNIPVTSTPPPAPEPKPPKSSRGRPRAPVPAPAPSPESPTPSPAPSPEGPAPSPESPTPSPAPFPEPNQDPAPTPPQPQPPILVPTSSSTKTSKNLVVILSASIGGSVLLLLLGIFFWRSNRVATVRPWATGLSGQLQKAFVTGVPKLKRSELEAACEDFSNVIGNLPIGTVYKGTLSSGVEIAVASVAVKSAKDWSKHLESQFRKKIDTLSRVNHKNFVNLLGFCEEEEPFTRMIVFEYAPNGTLFEHLHIQEAEHLDWLMRMRVAMGMAYCLDHMHQLSPPIAHKNLTSSSVSLTEDYAAKISDFSLSDETAVAEKESTLQSNVYNFGVILFEMVTGRMPYSVDSSEMEDWASDYLNGEKPLRDMADPTLKSFEPEQLEAIGGLIRACVDPDHGRRPRMRNVMSRLREITGIGPDGATPKISPLWWAELEILSTEAA